MKKNLILASIMTLVFFLCMIIVFIFKWVLNDMPIDKFDIMVLIAGNGSMFVLSFFIARSIRSYFKKYPL